MMSRELKIGFVGFGEAGVSHGAGLAFSGRRKHLRIRPAPEIQFLGNCCEVLCTSMVMDTGRPWPPCGDSGY